MLTQEQLALRRTGISGSDIAAIAGYSPWAEALDVYLAKVEGMTKDESRPLLLGHMFEPAIKALYSRDTGRIVEECPTVQHAECPLLMATPDGFTYNPDGSDPRGLEVKRAGPGTQRHWGEPDTDQIPPYYVPQVLLEAAVLKVDKVDVVGFFAGDNHYYQVDYDQAAFDALREVAERFWRDHVVARKPPPVGSSRRIREQLAERFPRSVLAARLATPQEEQLVMGLRQVRKDLEVLEERKETLELAIKSSMGGLEGIFGKDWALTWKNDSRGKPNYKALAEELGATPELIAKHTPVPGPRKFLLKFEEE
jgi:putative phage-type endonuclease